MAHSTPQELVGTDYTLRRLIAAGSRAGGAERGGGMCRHRRWATPPRREADAHEGEKLCSRQKAVLLGWKRSPGICTGNQPELTGAEADRRGDRAWVCIELPNSWGKGCRKEAESANAEQQPGSTGSRHPRRTRFAVNPEEGRIMFFGLTSQKSETGKSLTSMR